MVTKEEGRAAVETENRIKPNKADDDAEEDEFARSLMVV